MPEEIIKETAYVNGVLMPYAKISQKNTESRKTLVILPGLSLRPVTPAAEAVAEQYGIFVKNGYDIYLFDRRKNPPDGYCVRSAAEDTALIIDSLGIKNACVFGVSQGGMAAMLLAAGHPGLVSRLLIGSTSANVTKNEEKPFSQWSALALKKDGRALASAMGAAIYSPAVFGHFAEAIAASGADATDEDFSRFIIMAKAACPFDCRGELKNIVCPVYVIGCEGDRVFTAEPSREIMTILGCEGFIYGTEYGHAVYDEAPDYPQRLFDFCEK